MIELCVVVEGKTEEGFVRDVLAPHLRGRGVEAKASRVGRAGHKGGVGSFQRLKNQLRHWMCSDKRDCLRFSTMIDLYKLPNDFPGFAETRNCPDPRTRVKQLEVALKEALNDPRFIPYIQLHEFEALLLADPARFADAFPEDRERVPGLAGIARLKPSPELIDDGETTAPSKRIIELLSRYERMKSVAGPLIAEAIGLASIRKRCQHFGEWLNRLERLGTQG